MAVVYSMYAGHPWMNLETTRIRIPVQGYVKIKDKWAGGHDHESLLVISGKRLDLVFDHISMGKRDFSHPCAEHEEQQKSVITDIWVEELGVEESE